MIHTTDIFGNNAFYSNKGVSYIHTTDIFGNNVFYGSDGSEYIQTSDLFGNNVLRKTNGGSSPSYFSEGVGGFFGLILVFLVVLASLVDVVMSSMNQFATIGMLILLFVIWRYVFGSSRFRQTIAFAIFLYSCFNVQLANLGFTSIFAYLGVAIIGIVAWLSWLMSDSGDSSPVEAVLLLVLGLLMFGYLFVHQNETAIMLIKLSLVIVGLTTFTHDIILFLKMKNSNNNKGSSLSSVLLSNILMLCGGLAVLFVSRELSKLNNFRIAFYLTTALIIFLPIIFNRVVNMTGHQMVASPFGTLFCIVIVMLLVPNSPITEGFIYIVSQFGKTILPSVGSLVLVLLYLSLLFLISLLTYAIANILLNKHLKRISASKL